MQDSHQPDEVLTLKELGILLKLNPEIVRRRAKAGDIPCGRLVGGRWRFNKRAVLDWLAQGPGVSRQPSAPAGVG